MDLIENVYEDADEMVNGVEFDLFKAMTMAFMIAGLVFYFQ